MIEKGLRMRGGWLDITASSDVGTQCGAMQCSAAQVGRHMYDSLYNSAAHPLQTQHAAHNTQIANCRARRGCYQESSGRRPLEGRKERPETNQQVTSAFALLPNDS